MSRAARYVSAETPQPQHRPPAESTGRGIASLWPFRYRAFTLLWTAGFISTVGSWMQTVAVGALVAGRAGDALLPVFTPIGLTLLWLSALLTLYTGWDYFRAGVRHLIDD